MRLAILGSGALARAFVEALPARVRVRVAARRIAAARAIAKLRPGTVLASGWAQAVDDADVVLLAVDDRAIPGLAATIAPLRTSWRGVAVLHAAGALGREALAPLARRGASTGVVHPIVPLSRKHRSALAGAHARVEGAPHARRLAKAAGLVPLLRSRPERAADRGLHHAAAALATNDVVALTALAEDALVASGVRRPSARRAVVAAAAATLARVADDGPRGALSGPVPRGDAARVRAHLEALRSVHAAAGPAHAALATRLVDLAVEAGRLGARETTALRAALRGPRGKRTV